MEPSKGSSLSFRSLKLGRGPTKTDPRTLRFASLLRVQSLPPIPTTFDVDRSLVAPSGPLPEGTVVPAPMRANDTHGDCVMAARAHFIVRAEARETGQILEITDAEVLREYFRESHGFDSGLVMLDSLKQWRRSGLRVGGIGDGKVNADDIKHPLGRAYKCEAFASLPVGQGKSMRAAIAFLGGAYVGISLPLSAADQIDAGAPWTVTSGAPAAKGSWGGHCVLIVAYGEDRRETSGGVVVVDQWFECITWGRRQRMSLEFLQTYCDEAYAVCDKVDRWVANPGIDGKVLREYLDEIAKQDV